MNLLTCRWLLSDSRILSNHVNRRTTSWAMCTRRDPFAFEITWHIWHMKFHVSHVRHESVASCRVLASEVHWFFDSTWSFGGDTWRHNLPSGKRLHNYGKSPFLMGKSTISMAIFNSYVSHYQRVSGLGFTGFGRGCAAETSAQCAGSALAGRFESHGWPYFGATSTAGPRYGVVQYPMTDPCMLANIRGILMVNVTSIYLGKL